MIDDTLPVEVFTQILRHAFPSWQATDCSRWHTALTHLRLVCHKWNQVVISTHEFWTFYDFDLHDTGFPVWLFQKWLERSGDAMVDISLRESSRATVGLTTAEDEKHSNFLLTMGSHITHCKSLRLRFGSNLIPKLHALNLSRATGLDRIHLILLGEDDTDLGVVLQHLKSVPNPREFEWRAGHPHSLRIMLDDQPPPWLDQLTRIEVGCQMSPGEALRLMHQCASAVEITILKWPHPDGDTHSAVSPTITLSNLRLLHISFFDATRYAFLRQLHLPNLRGFHYCEWSTLPGHTHAEAQVNLANLSDWMVNSASSLEILRVEYTHSLITFDQLRAFLCHPHAIKLCIFELRIIHSFSGNMDDVNSNIVEACEGIRTRFRMTKLVHGSSTMGWVDKDILQRYSQDFPGSSLWTDLDPHLLS